MATISNTPRPGYVWDSTDNVWYPIGVGAHQHTNAADTSAVIPKALTTTTGDIIYASAANTPARLGVGSTGQVLNVSSGVPAWTTPGMTLITRSSFSNVASATFDSVFSSTYKTYIVNIEQLYSPSGNNDSSQMQMRYGTTTETGASYAGMNINGNYSTSTITGSNMSAANQILLTTFMGGGTGEPTTASLVIQNVGTGSSVGASINGFAQSNRNYTANFIGVTTNTVRNYTGFLLKNSAGANIYGTVAIYGYGV